ncbi:hypothetical protein [Haloarchaeobius amylolyticus]|uniref:hypothetical protein n=1 Tax=Haloarchaeobius amylolyticus TaxID=1198296 RepID=UPI002271B054|nr:hypothetical protein [Haloarchaeobius amylolyticus]
MPLSRTAFEERVADLPPAAFREFVAALLAVEAESLVRKDGGKDSGTVFVRDGEHYRVVTGDASDEDGGDEDEQGTESDRGDRDSTAADRLVYHPAVAPPDPPGQVLDLYSFACYGLDRASVDEVCTEYLGTRMTRDAGVSMPASSTATATVDSAEEGGDTSELAGAAGDDEEESDGDGSRFAKRPDGLAASPEFLRYGAAPAASDEDVGDGATDQNPGEDQTADAGYDATDGWRPNWLTSTPRLVVLGLVVVAVLLAGGGLALGLLPGDDGGAGADGVPGSDTSIAAEDPEFRLDESDTYPGDFGGDTLADPTPNDGRPPGLGAYGVTDASTLAQAHANALAGESYRWTLEFGATADPSTDGPVWRVAREVVTVENRTVYSSELTGVTIDGEAIEQTGSADGETREVVTKKGNTYAINREPVMVRYGEGYHEDRAERFVELYLDTPRSIRSGSYSVDGLTYHRVVGWNAPPGLSNVTDYRFVAVVTEDGLVTDLTVKYERSTPAGDQTVTVSFHYDDVGEPGIDAGVNGTTTGEPTTSEPTTADPTTTDSTTSRPLTR